MLCLIGTIALSAILHAGPAELFGLAGKTEAAGVLVSMGIHTVSDLKGRDPQALFDQLCELTRVKQDRCVLYTFRCAVYYASNSRHDPEKLKWWNWMDDSPAMQKSKR